jgi:tRNA(Arg) A34 adenosine deaminase TadA
MSSLPGYFDAKSNLARFWERPLSDAAVLPSRTFEKRDIERHSIYLGLLMAMVTVNWNGNKNGSRDGEYLTRTKQRRPDGTYLGDRLGDRYLGHNIAAFAVDSNGRIVDFDFNHNKLFNSSVQHAEARLIRRLFGLAAVQDSWDLTVGPKKYRTDLNDTTVYTSLESCAQCAGIMALANLRTVIYLQPDPGQYMIGQIIKNLSDTRMPEHIPASVFGLLHFERLVEAYKKYQSDVENGTVFWRSLKDPLKLDKGQSITSFLCTDMALDVYREGCEVFSNFVCEYPDYAPMSAVTNTAAMTNKAVLEHARQFLDYVEMAAQRGTPHFN